MRRSVSIGLLLLAIASFWMAGRLNRIVLAARTMHDSANLELRRASPLVAFTTVALGGFRGIVADVLWMRAEQLQDEGKYFAIVQLADWITKLEPHLTEVWAYHAWNMAYNISVMFPDPEDRWRWVNSGLRLLRDDGIRYDPLDPRLYAELGWIYQYKIGGPWDDCGPYYRRQMAQRITALIGGAHPNYAALDPASSNATALAQEYGLQPALMSEVDAQYGPLDWRTPQAHSIYWAYRGLKARSDSIECDRIIFQSLASCFFRGRLLFDPPAGPLIQLPDTSIVPKVCQAYEAALAKYHQDSIANAYTGFLEDSITTLCALGETNSAASLYALYRTKAPAGAPAGGVQALSEQGVQASVQNLEPAAAASVIEQTCFQSDVWLSLGDSARAEGLNVFARRMWLAYRALHPDETSTGSVPGDFESLRARARTRALSELWEPLRTSLEEAPSRPSEKARKTEG